MGSLIKSRVARGLFVLFVISALLPLSLLAILSFTQVRSLLLTQGDNRLAAQAKSYGMGVFERLLLATDVAYSAGSIGANDARRDSMAPRAFRNLTSVRGNSEELLFGEPHTLPRDALAIERIQAGNPVLEVSQDGKLYLAVPTATGYVMGQLRPDYVWGPVDELPALTEFCVLREADRLLLFCSSAEAREVLRVGTMAGNAVMTWKRGDESMRTRAWVQFMKAALGASDWTVLASQTQAQQLRASLDFERTYALVVVLALLLVTWFTVRKSRDIVIPVMRLAERARGIAANDFKSRVEVNQADEFGELAGAFNQMTGRLGKQFASLTALSEIDRMILDTQDVTQVVRAVLHRMEEVVSADQIALVLIDEENEEHARTYFRPPQQVESMTMERVPFSPEDRRLLGTESGMRRIPLAGSLPTPSYLAPLRARGMGVVFVQPIVWRGSVVGALVLGHVEGDAVLDGDERRHASEIADRVAVAVSSAWREDKLYQQAHYDPLTRLPNRMLFQDRLEREIARGQRESLKCALLFIDLDHFKNVNDSFGHSLGDEVLREAGRRILRCVRESDTVSRLGGDEFTVLLTRLNSPQEAWLIAEAIVESLSQEFRLGEQHCFLSASIGIASYPTDAGSAEELLKSADTAMYRAKAEGRAQAVFYEERMNREALARVTLDRDLRAAVDHGEIVLHYQPQIDLRTGAIRSAEALVRWEHPVHGLVSPARFIPLAEESGFIEQLGRWILREACAQMKEWQAQGLRLESVAVNVSPRQFRRRTLVQYIRNLAMEAGLPPSCLEIEITEGTLMDREGPVEEMLRELADAGHRIALDDFGTGFSSMSYLKRLPVNTIKIDRAFVDGMDQAADSEAIVTAMVAMSHALGKTVIAEGVETQEQEAILRRLGCDEVQGFLYAPALPAAEFAALVRAWRPTPVPA
jgi:diguanylate cyclase (GGDEF)-like protein